MTVSQPPQWLCGDEMFFFGEICSKRNKQKGTPQRSCSHLTFTLLFKHSLVYQLLVF